MSRLRRMGTVGTFAALALVGTGSAFAATPQQIYRDIGDNGKLDRQYSAADLDRAFDLLSVVGTDPRPADGPKLNQIMPARAAPPRATKRSDRRVPRSDRRVPFSALDAALFGAGCVPLLLIVAGFGSATARLKRSRPVSRGRGRNRRSRAA